VCAGVVAATQLQHKLSEARSTLCNSIDPNTGKRLFHPETGRAPRFSRNTSQQPVSEYLYSLSQQQVRGWVEQGGWGGGWGGVGLGGGGGRQHGLTGRPGCGWGREGRWKANVVTGSLRGVCAWPAAPLAALNMCTCCCAALCEAQGA
jgi:hypothetical protein